MTMEIGHNDDDYDDDDDDVDDDDWLRWSKLDHFMADYFRPKVFAGGKLFRRRRQDTSIKNRRRRMPRGPCPVRPLWSII